MERDGRGHGRGRRRRDADWGDADGGDCRDRVTVTWSVSSVGAGALAGYRVKRYDSLSGVASTIGGNCTGVVAATSCIDSSAPLGTTPMHHAWTGTEGGRSTSVVITL